MTMEEKMVAVCEGKELDDEQKLMIQTGFALGLSVEEVKIYAKPENTAEQMYEAYHEILKEKGDREPEFFTDYESRKKRLGMAARGFEILKMEPLTEPMMEEAFGLLEEVFDEDQMFLITEGFELGLSPEQVEMYADTRLDWMQMYEVEQGLLNGLSVEQVREYAHFERSYEEMEAHRKQLEAANNLVHAPGLLRDDADAKALLEILMKNGMEAEGVNYAKLLTNLDGMTYLFKQQDEMIRVLQEQVESLQKPTIRERAAVLVEDMKAQAESLQSQLNQIKDTVREKARTLVQAFQERGKVAFYKSFASFATGLSSSLEMMREEMRRKQSEKDTRIEQFSNISNEIGAVKTHLKNIGRLLTGKRTKTLEEEKGSSIIVDEITENMKKTNRRYARMETSLTNSIEKLCSLEQSFQEKSRESKKNLSELISGAKAEKEKQHVMKRDEPEMNRKSDEMMR